MIGYFRVLYTWSALRLGAGGHLSRAADALPSHLDSAFCGTPVFIPCVPIVALLVRVERSISATLVTA